MKLFEAHSFLTILNESIKLLPKNGKLMAYIAFVSIVLYASFLFLFIFSLVSLMDDILVTSLQSSMPNPSSSFTPKTTSNPAQITSPLRQDLVLLFALQIAFYLSFAIISFFSMISTIIVSSSSYTAKNLSLKELFLRIGTTWTRPLITTFYVSGLTFGYFVIIVTLITPLLLMYPNLATLSVAILIAIIACIFYLYLFAVWALAIVVSVVEESCYGLDALQKAKVLVKGKRLHGFLLIICSNVVVLIISQVYKMIFVNPTLYGLFFVSVSILVKIYFVVSYTVLYFECKKHHGEEIELRGSVEYTKLANDQLGNDMP